MKIHYLAFIRLPTEKAHGAQIMKTCEALAAHGATVELIVPGRKTHVAGDPFEFYEVSRSFSITEVRAPDLVHRGWLGYVVSLMWFSEAAKMRTQFWEADVVYSRDAGLLLQYLLLGRRLVYEAHTKPTFVSRLIARRAHRVVAISEALRNTYITYGVRPDRIVCAHDAIDVEPFATVLDSSAKRRSLGIPLDKTIALYVGRMDSTKGADTLARAAAYVPESHRVVLVGSGPEKEKLRKECPQALFLPETPYRDLPHVLSVADILVAPNSAKDTDAALYTSPLKAYAYLASKKPVVATDVPALRAVFGTGARYVEPDNPKGLADAIIDPGTRSAIPSVVPHTWKERAETILKTLS